MDSTLELETLQVYLFRLSLSLILELIQWSWAVADV